MTTLRVSLVSFALVLTSAILGGCAAEPDPGDADETTVEVAASSGDVGPQRLGYVARVTRADIRAGGGSCAGNLCTINGKMWDCTGGGYCSTIGGN